MTSLNSNDPRSLDSGRDLVRNAGYEEGDVIPLYTFNNQANLVISTTSTTYTGVSNTIDNTIQFDTLPSDNIVAGLSSKVSVGSGETYDIRLFNNTDNEEIVSETITDETANLPIFSGFVDYTPTTTSSPVSISFEHRSNPGSNSSAHVSALAIIGVQL